MLNPRLFTVFAIYCVLFFAIPAPAQICDFLPPVEVSFEQGLAKADGDKLQIGRMLRETIYETREESYTVTVKVQESVIDPVTKQEKTLTKDVPETRTRTVSVPRSVFKQIQTAVDWSQVTARRTDGSVLEKADLQTRLAKPALVVISTNGEPLPASYAILFKPETVVLDLNKALHGYGMMMPMPDLAPAPRADLFAPAPAPVASAPALAAAAPPAPFAPAPAPVAPVDLEGLTFPNGAPPKFRLLSINAEDQYVVRATAQKKSVSTAMVMKTEKRTADGKEVEVQVCVPISVSDHREMSHSVAYPALVVSGRTVDSKPLGELHLAALKQREIPVVTSDIRAIDPAWLQNIRPNMLVITTPSAPPPAPPPPGPAFALPPPGDVPPPVAPPPPLP